MKSGSWKVVLVLAASSILLALGIQNIALKSSFRLLDDGVFWESQEGRVVAKRIDPEGPAARAGLRIGDVLVMIDHAPVDRAADVRAVLDRASQGSSLTYQVLREAERRAPVVTIAPLPRGNVGIYYFLAAVGIFTLVVGTVVYVRRRGVAATAHFYLLCLFWFLAFTFTPTGKLDAWDTAFYWLDQGGGYLFPSAVLALCALFPGAQVLR